MYRAYLDGEMTFDELLDLVGALLNGGTGFDKSRQQPESEFAGTSNLPPEPPGLNIGRTPDQIRPLYY